jgi:hypothetical protein
MNVLRQTLHPHIFGPGEYFVDLWHVHDSQSQTKYQLGIGIQCGDQIEYVMNPWHIITPRAMRQHLDWRNRRPTQFISFYDNQLDASREAQRRRNLHQQGRGPIRIAHVRLPRGSNVWSFSREEMLGMMNALNNNDWQLMAFSGAREWFVWGFVPDRFVLDVRSN